MITIQETISLPETYPLERLGKREELLFFDIETTGFSGDTSRLYLIGCTYYKEQEWHLIQWFADTTDSEEELLHAFFNLLSHYRTVVHFNGDGFDIPYLLKRCSHYHLSYDFSEVKSIDIYKRFRPYKNLLGLPNIKQKTIEAFLGISREDKYNGGELILVYQDYLQSKDPYLYRLLILHNADDLKGMPSILPALYYPDFLESAFTVRSEQVCENRTGDLILILEAESTCSIPTPFDAVSPIGTLHAEGNSLILRIPMYQGTLKYFYADYKNYYYLPAEDKAIHKSVGEFVDPSARKKATAQTCYTKASGLFLPQLAPVFEPALSEERKSAITYSRYQEHHFADSAKCTAFIQNFLQKSTAPKADTVS